MIPVISISGGQPVMLFPLSVVILVSMIKDIFEDSKRHKSDNVENNKIVEVYNPITTLYQHQTWKSLRVG